MAFLEDGDERADADFRVQSRTSGGSLEPHLPIYRRDSVKLPMATFQVWLCATYGRSSKLFLFYHHYQVPALRLRKQNYSSRALYTGRYPAVAKLISEWFGYCGIHQPTHVASAVSSY